MFGSLGVDIARKLRIKTRMFGRYEVTEVDDLGNRQFQISYIEDFQQRSRVKRVKEKCPRLFKPAWVLGGESTARLAY